jgi:ketosteroid isomerase-like protein
MTPYDTQEVAVAEALTQEEIQDLADRWYGALDVHAPVAELHAMMTDEGNDMEWPELPTHGHVEFTVWYEKVTRRFFDEVHTIKSVEATIDEGGNRADVKVVVNWKASVWEPPAPKSITIHMDAYQTWEVVRDSATGKALINKYFVDSFSELPDSDGGLGVDPRDVLIAFYRSASAGDWQTWLTLFHEDVVIDGQLAGHVEGLDTLRGAIGAMEKGYSRFQDVPKHIVCQGDNAAVVSHTSAANAAGEPIEAEVTHYFQLRDGKIAYMASVHDTRAFDPFVNQ